MENNAGLNFSTGLDTEMSYNSIQQKLKLYYYYSVLNAAGNYILKIHITLPCSENFILAL